MVEKLKPTKGGFLRVFGCAWFVREYLAGRGPYDSPRINPKEGAPQSEIFYEYKTALLKATAEDRGTRDEERLAEREGRRIDPDNIERLTAKHLKLLPYRSSSCRYHSFVVYFSNLQRLHWVEFTGREQPSAFQDNYPHGQPRRYYRLTSVGLVASDSAWANPRLALYGSK